MFEGGDTKEKGKKTIEQKTNEVLKSIWERMKLSTFKNTLLNKNVHLHILWPG